MSMYRHPASIAILETLTAMKPLTVDFGNRKSGPVSFSGPLPGLQFHTIVVDRGKTPLDELRPSVRLRIPVVL